MSSRTGSRPDSTHVDNGVISTLFAAARRGSGVAVGELLQGCRDYLLLVANAELGDDLQAKAGASDLVQDTFLEAQRDFARFHGTREPELRAWLRQILLNNLANFRRQYQRTEKRRVDLERSLTAGLSAVKQDELLLADTTSPSGKAVHNEESSLLLSALEQLPADHRQVIEARNLQLLSFVEIGRMMNRSPDAVRQLWIRALEALYAKIRGADVD